jgi:hypothetical protein
MTAAPQRLHLSLVASNTRRTHAEGKRRILQKSLEKVFDPYKFRTEFPDLWAQYLRGNFPNIEHVAVAFDVTFQCASNWWTGANRPSGDKVALAAIRDPEGFAEAMQRLAS